MKFPGLVALGGLLGSWVAQAEPRTFTDTEGRTVEAQPLAVEDGSLVMKLTNGKSATVPLDTLSANDQAFIADWWKENKNRLEAMDVSLAIDKKTKRIDRQVSRSGGGNNQNTSPVVKKLTIDEFHYTGELKSYARKDVSDITVNYTIYKRVSTHDKDGSKTTTEEIEGSTTIRMLEALGTETFETDPVRCEDSSQTGGNGPRLWKRETITGIVFTLSSGGKEFLKQSDPENLIERMEEERKREEDRAD